MAKLWLLYFYLLQIQQGPVNEPKGFSKAPGSYHWALVIFIYLFMHLFIYLLIYLFFNLNKFLLTVVSNNFLQLSLLKLF